ncbi:hypothetical protein PINS_up007328 [Pythium insidiosum]|nr:hypothetical protein PINS_up007328 [Pythium insidiosum]
MTTDKLIYCVRHGESQFNEWRTRSLWTFSWVHTRDPMILDPRLSARGHKQVDGLYNHVRDKALHDKIEVIVVSPLTRAIQTAEGGFRGTDIPMIVDPLCREMLDTSSDIGRDAAALASDFQSLNLDFSELEPHWWVPPRLKRKPELVLTPSTADEVMRLRESKEDLDERMRAFVSKLTEMPQSHIAIVGHSHFFKRMLGNAP